MKEENSKKDINRAYKEVTCRIVMRLAEGDIPWRKRWCSPVSGKMNWKSRRRYGGVNLLLLEDEGEYMTFNQCREAGGHVRKGEKSHTIYQRFPVFRTKEAKEEYERRQKAGQDTSDIDMMWILSTCSVFHLSQTEGVKTKIEHIEHAEARTPTDMADFVIDEYKHTMRMNITEMETDACSWNDGERILTVPSRKQFGTEEQFYNTVFGQLAKIALQATDNDGARKEKPQVQRELEAEIASCMMMSGVGLAIPQTEQDTLAECSKWMLELNRDFRLIVRASTSAQKAAETILQPIL